MALKKFRVGDNEVYEVDGRADETVRNSSKSKKLKKNKSKNSTRVQNIGAIENLLF